MKKSLAKLILLIFIVVSFSQAYILKSCVIDNGGVCRMTSSGYIMGASVGQSFGGKLTSSGYIAHIGYWHNPYAPPGIEEMDREQDFGQPVVFSLSPNYPNPVYSKTSIKYSIPKACKVELRLFDVTGRQVAVLVNENQQPGYYQVNWDIRNVSEKQLANGVYFYRLTTDEYVDTRKMIIVR